MTSGPLLIGLLFLAILFIIYGTAYLELHPFLVLLVAAYGFGVLAGLPALDTVEALTRGFGETLRYIGIVIAAGAIIGTVLERSGGAFVMAQSIVRWVGRARSALAMGVTGAVVSIPVFCDSGFIILAPLARSLAAKARQSMAFYAVTLSMGLYATHVFVPPTPGPIAAASELGADLGAVILLGLVTTIPVLIITYLFGRHMGRRMYIDPQASADRSPAEDTAEKKPSNELPSPARAFLPIVVPVVLIALKSFAELPAHPLGVGAVAYFLSFVGDPNTALLVGVFLAFLTVRARGGRVYTDWVGKALRAAGAIILITGAGGALGGVLQATPIGVYLGQSLGGLELGTLNILLPFALAAALKTALGSSTVAIITTASIVAPLLGPLGLEAGLGPTLTTLAIGAGSMTVSHVNDSYFWVVSQFSGMDVVEGYKLQTAGSAVAGVTGITTVLVLALLLL